MKILVVEDDLDMQALTCHFLRKAEVAYDTAMDGQEGMDKALTNVYDLILLDLQLPIYDGFEVAQSLREQGVKVPILALTGHLTKSVREKCLKTGFNDYLIKPLTPDAIGTLLTQFQPR